jgi:dGTPase
VREGIAKHSGPIDVEAAPEFAEYEPELQPPLEAQMIDLVDEIAYNHHDIDDGLDSGLLDLDHLADAVPLFGEPFDQARRAVPSGSRRQLYGIALRTMIDALASDLIDTTRRNVLEAGADSTAEVRGMGRPLVELSPGMSSRNAELKGYLHLHLYQHHRIERMKDKSRRILEALFQRYLDNSRLLPDETRLRMERDGLERTIADYIAGMTDRYASQEHRRLFDPSVRV